MTKTTTTSSNFNWPETRNQATKQIYYQSMHIEGYTFGSGVKERLIIRQDINVDCVSDADQSGKECVWMNGSIYYKLQL